MRSIILIVALGILFLAACSGNVSSSTNANEDVTLTPVPANANEDVTLTPVPANENEDVTQAPVPAEFAGLTNPLGPEAAAAGAEVFRTKCEMCHGPQGHGDGPAGQSLEPKPGNLAKIQTAAGDDFLFWRIREGKPGTSMLSWKGILTDEQIWQTVAFIRTLK